MCLTKSTLTYDEIYTTEKPYGSTMRITCLDNFGRQIRKQTWVVPENQDNILRTCRNEIKETGIIAIESGNRVCDENPFKTNFYLKLMCLSYLCDEDNDEIRVERINYTVLIFTKKVNCAAVLAYLTKNQGFVRMPASQLIYNPDFQKVACDAYEFGW